MGLVESFALGAIVGALVAFAMVGLACAILIGLVRDSVSKALGG